MRKEEALLLYAIQKGYKLNVGKIIKKSILNYYNSKYRGLIPQPGTITRLCILGGVKGTREEEERCSRTSPLTLIGITRPLPSKCKEKVQEIGKEDRDGRENEKTILVSSVKEREIRQRSVSPIWTLSPDVREFHQGLTKSSEQQSNNMEILEMLKRMEQSMRERDNQLKFQL